MCVYQASKRHGCRDHPGGVADTVILIPVGRASKPEWDKYISAESWEYGLVLSKLTSQTACPRVGRNVVKLSSPYTTANACMWSNIRSTPGRSLDWIGDADVQKCIQGYTNLPPIDDGGYRSGDDELARVCHKQRLSASSSTYT